MARQRHCWDCHEAGKDPWHPVDAWPHQDEERPATLGILDDHSFRRAYGFGQQNTGMKSGLGVEFDSRAALRDHLKANGLVEAGQDTPSRAGPSAVELSRKRRLFEKAYEKARRGPRA
jgi:hypothetical protein